MLWEDLREEQFDAALEESNKLCVIPVGCLEMHGQHLPVGTDVKTVYHIAREAAKKESAVVFPPLYFGSVPGLYMWKGSVNLSLELRLRILAETCAEIARNGFKRIMLLNGHGGNVATLETFVRSVLESPKDYVVVARNEYQYGIQRLAREIRAGERFDELTEEDVSNVLTFCNNQYLTGHACINETSIMLEIDGEHVDMSRADAADGKDRRRTAHLRRKPYSIDGGVGFWLLDHPDSFEGEHVELASANIGRVILRKRIEYQAEACRLLKQDEGIFDVYNYREK